MITSVLYLCLYAWHLVLPGYLIVRLLAIRRGTFLMSIAFSYSLLLLNLMPLEWLKAPVWVFTLAFNLQVTILLIANIVVAWHQCGARNDKAGIRRTEISSWNSVTNCMWRHRNRWWPPLLIVAGVLVYLAWAGPYLELSADPWVHIERFLNARQISLESGHFNQCHINQFGRLVGSGSLLDFLTRQGGHWYILQALLCRLSGLAIPDLPGPLTLANTLVFCLAIYGFALFLWSRQRIHRVQKIQASLWTVVFTVLWLGINIFAYIRYYALAPAILNYVIYLAAVILILDYFRSRSWWGHALWLVPLLVMAMNVIHSQEAAFACFMGLGMLIVMEGQWVWGRSRWSEIRGQKSDVRDSVLSGNSQMLVPPMAGIDDRGQRSDVNLTAGNMLKIHILFVAGLILFGLLFYYSLQRPMGVYSDFLLRPLFHGEWLGQKWFIQPPTGQFAQVVTWWGVFVYGLFLLHIHYFKRQPFILAGMLMPCLIVFNPLTLVILSRWVSDLNVIYRFNYMIPLPFVAGFLAMHFWNEIKLSLRKFCPGVAGSLHRSGPPATLVALRAGVAAVRVTALGGENCNGLPARGMFTHLDLGLREIWSAAALLGLLVLLTPVETLMGRLSNSRFYTLKPLAEGNDQRRWGDLIALVRKHPQVNVLTDWYTFALLQRMDVKVMDGGWWVAPSAQGADRLALLRNLDRKQDWWLVVNRRNGDFSMNGARSGHWGGDAWTHFSTAYSEDMLLFVKQHPELFKEIWSKDQIQVYDIVESRVWE